jgi:hypothetical protein
MLVIALDVTLVSCQDRRTEAEAAYLQMMAESLEVHQLLPTPARPSDEASTPKPA